MKYICKNLKEVEQIAKQILREEKLKRICDEEKELS